MKTFELVSRMEARGNIPALGYGDYVKVGWKRESTVEALDERDAQRKFKKLFPTWKLKFSGAFPNYMVWEVTK